MKMKVCGKCRGNKQIAAMGGIKTKCPTCKGLGATASDKVEAVIKDTSEAVFLGDDSKKKMGRPKKIVPAQEE